MTDMLEYSTGFVVTRAMLFAPELVDFRWNFMFDATAAALAHKRRVMVFPTLRIREEPDNLRDGTRITLSVMTVPMEAV
jgi:hypothetical protein